MLTDKYSFFAAESAAKLLFIIFLLSCITPQYSLAEQLEETEQKAVFACADMLSKNIAVPVQLHMVSEDTTILQRYTSAMLAFALSMSGFEISKTAGADMIPPDFVDIQKPPADIIRKTQQADYLLMIRMKEEDDIAHAELRLWSLEPAEPKKFVNMRFRISPNILAIRDQAPEAPPRDDNVWHRLFEKLVRDCDSADMPRDEAWLFGESAFFFENGYWRLAAEKYSKLNLDSVNVCFLQKVLAQKWSTDAAGALKSINDMLKLHPDSGPLYAMKTWQTFRQGETDDALMFLKQARLSDMAREGYYIFAQYLILLQDGKTADAEQPLTLAVEALPDVAFVQLQAARYYWRRAQLETSVGFYQKAIETGIESAEVYIEFGLALEASGNTHAAIEAFMNAFQSRRGDLSVARHLSFMLRSAGRYEDALKVLAECVEANPENAVAAAAMGDFSIYSWRISEGIAAYNEALLRDPDFGYARVALACAYLLKRNPDKAIALMGRSLQNDRQDARALLMLGEALLHRGQIEEAIENLEKAARNSEHEHMARIALSNALLEKGEPDRAVRQAQLAIASKPDPRAFAALARAFMTSGQPRDARHAIDKGLLSTPGSPDLLCASIELLLNQARNAETEERKENLYKEALKLAEKTIEIDPFHLDAYLLGGYSALGLQDFGYTADMWGKAAGLDRWDPELAWKLANILYYQSDSPKKAGPYFQRHIELNGPFAEEAAEYLKKL